MSSNPGVWFEIYVNDMARARAFYEALLQVELTPMNMPEFEMLGFPASEGGGYGAGGALVRHADFPGGGGGTIIYLGCEDCGVTAGRAEAAGGQVVQSKFSIGEHGHVALVKDSEGNIVGLHSMT
jgi:predicted enzyme related to lactoylglutathione lyase